MLRNDHTAVERLFKRYEDAGPRAFVEKRTIVDRIIEELSVHAAVEEQVFYPVTRVTVPAVQRVALESLEEHHVVDVLISEAGALTPGEEAWLAKLTVLIENVEHHAGEEESELFPKVRRVFASDDLEAQARRLEARKSQLGAPTMADKEHLTVDDLRRLAQDQEIPGRSSMDREELLATVALG